MNPTQFYETTIYNRDARRGFTYVTIPARAVPDVTLLEVESVGDSLGFERILRVEPIEQWSAPFLFDAALGRYPDFPFAFDFPFIFERGAPPPRRGRGPSDFAQYLAYERVVPFETSPLSAQSFASVLGAGGGVGGAVGYYATGDPLILVAVPAGIIICGAAAGVADALRIGLRARILEMMGVDDPDDVQPRS